MPPMVIGSRPNAGRVGSGTRGSRPSSPYRAIPSPPFRAWPFPDGEAFLTYLDGSRILFTKYSFAKNSFTPEEVAQSGVTGSSAPVLSYGWGGSLDLFWAGAPYDNHIFYKRNSGGVWDSSFTDWVDENVELLASYDALTSFYFSGNGRGLLYLTRPSPPKPGERGR